MATVAAAGSPRAFAKRKLFMPRMDSYWYACKRTQQIHRSRRKIHYNKTDYDQSHLPKHARIINLKASRAEVLNKWVSPQFDRKTQVISRRRKRVKLKNHDRKSNNSSHKLPTSRSCKPITLSDLSFSSSHHNNTDPIPETTFDPNLSSSQCQHIDSDNLSLIKSDFSDSNSPQSRSVTTPSTIFQENISNDTILVSATPLSSYKDRWIARSKLSYDYI